MVNQATECLHRISLALELAADPELAYTARSRLQRAVLSCTRYAAREAGLPEPPFPGRYEMSRAHPEILRAICETANRLLDCTQTICQPSEPLDERWTRGRLEIVANLEQLRQIIRQYTNAPAGTRRAAS